MYTYALTTSMAARINLDNHAEINGYEDAHAHFPDGVLSGDALITYAHELVDTALEEGEETLTDDPDEYRARYVDAYCTAYNGEIAELTRERDE